VPSDETQYVGLAIGAAIALAGIGAAYFVYRLRAGLAGRLRERFSAVHEVLRDKYYFDELIDELIVGPVRAAGRFSQSVVERLVVDRLIVGGTSGAARAGAAAVRILQSGLMRMYALLVAFGVLAMAIYFLVVAR
jgi:NADH-quinone oxidoreductase subunit L